VSTDSVSNGRDIDGTADSADRAEQVAGTQSGAAESKVPAVLLLDAGHLGQDVAPTSGTDGGTFGSDRTAALRVC